MSHALLLRLFLSPSFFSVHVALQYLRVYADNIGITYYLTRRLRELDTQDLREVWGFICHLLVTRPSRSKALESFVVEVAHRSTHIAMLTLWYMQAYLKDLSEPRSNPVSFLICQRVLHECHEIIFGDLPGQSSVPYSSLSLPSQLRHLRRKMHLLRSHYCSSEVQFILALENICNKLLVVPKPARVSALRAELTGLNHMLPAEVCMPMWCTSSDTPQPPNNIPQPHHRIVRIPPGESVVLNSAERAPYLLLLEILHDDLDFDPGKRSNREILKKIVIKENESKGTSRDLASFTKNDPRHKHTLVIPNNVNGSEVALGTDAGDAGDATSEPLATSPSVISPSTGQEEEEIDLVEQLYGTDSSLRANEMDLSDSIVLPPPPKNKELDMVTWSRTSSNPDTPFLDMHDPFGTHTPSLNLTIPTPVQRGGSSSDPNTPLRLQQSQGAMATRVLSLDEYSERMRTAAVMLAQLNASLVREPVTAVTGPGMLPPPPEPSMLGAPLRWLPGTSWLTGASANGSAQPSVAGSSTEPGAVAAAAAAPMRMKLQASEAAAIRDRIMQEMLALEEERMARMRENGVNESSLRIVSQNGDMKTAEDEGIIRRELSKADPSAVVFSESWAAKKARVRQASPYGHLANWDCVSVIVKTGGDLRQEQLAVQLIQEFEKIWKEENCQCWVRYFRILITGNSSGLVETITDAVSIHSIKKAEYARRLADGRLGHVTLLDHFRTTYGDPSSAKYVRAQRNFAKSLAGYSLVTYLLQIKDRHNGNILLDRDGHLIHIDFGFMLSNSPGNIGFEAAPFKLPLEYIEVLGGLDSPAYREFRKLFHEGFNAARKHCDRIVTLVELMQKDSSLPCFAAFGEQTATLLRERFQQGLTQAAVEEHIQRLIDTSLGSNWTRLYDSYQYYSQSIL
ncbi:kinase-like protein [Pilatotrama ljubarskyi]|nr:kinase-like protein [Pilatotrama ljubarskyi]